MFLTKVDTCDAIYHHVVKVAQPLNVVFKYFQLCQLSIKGNGLGPRFLV